MNNSLHNLAVIILAAGKGTRMKSDLPKVLHPIAGKPMLWHVMQAAQALKPAKTVVITGHGAELVESMVNESFPTTTFARQTEQKGTGHAVQICQNALQGFTGTVLILLGDSPLLQPADLQAALHDHQSRNRQVTFLTTTVENPAGFGRITRDAERHVTGIVEDKNCTPEQLAITEVNSGHCLAESASLWHLLAQLTPNPPKNEYYLTDILHLALQQGLHAGAYCQPGGDMLMGVNDPLQLATMETIWQQSKRRQVLLSGVTMTDPATVYFSPDTCIAPNVHIGPNVVFGPGVTIEPEVTIMPFCHISGAHIHQGAQVGPFARIRPGSTLGPQAEVGNFVEINNTSLGQKTKAKHLSYLGNADVGDDVNLGAGTITANYNRKTGKKSRTTVGHHASTGAGTILVAPVTLGSHAATGAGTTVRDDVEDAALLVTQPPQKVKSGYNK